LSLLSSTAAASGSFSSTKSGGLRRSSAGFHRTGGALLGEQWALPTFFWNLRCGETPGFAETPEAAVQE